MKIDRQSSTPSYVQVADHLKAEILSGRFQPGSRLPSELELVSQSKLSRLTVRRGVEILENEGWVVRRQGLGTFVRHAINQELSSAQTIAEVLLAKGIVPKIKVLSFGPVRPPENVRTALRLGKNERLLLVERLYLKGDESVALLRIFLPLSARKHAQFLRNADAPTQTTFTMWEKDVGVRIKGAAHAIRAAKADADDAAALGVAVGDPVLILDRITYATDGRPLEYVMYHYHWERYEFSVTAPRVNAISA